MSELKHMMEKVITADSEAAHQNSSSQGSTKKVKLPPMAITENHFDTLFKATTKTISYLEAQSDQNSCLSLNKKSLSALLAARLSSASSLGNRFKRMVRTTSEALNKQIDFKLKGFDVEIDRNLLNYLNEILTHMLRNSVDHGIESAEIRAQQSKNPMAQILLEIQTSTDKTTVILQDDGGGISPEIVCQKAIEKGLINEVDANSMTVYEKQSLIFSHGFSTKAEASEISGRGVGMDAVMDVVNTSGGKLTFQSEPGVGTTFFIDFPSPYQFDQVVIFTLKGQHFFISTQYVNEIKYNISYI